MIREIAGKLRRMDRFELKAVGCRDAEQGIRQSIAGSMIVMYMADKNERPVCIFGISSEVYEQGRVIWCLGTDDIDRHKKEFVKHSREILRWWTAQYGQLFNYVSVQNIKALAWLKRMGAEFHRPFLMNETDIFRMFTIRGDG
ncbi:MAG: DUF2833 domain-containing protein [Bacteroidales bacterium]|nr:DUF2833 domain-containing protein [Bacteroidales bacterium]MBQ8809526.1 DUF2833 domain-containing protein [Bacteroidales bacterium]